MEYIGLVNLISELSKWLIHSSVSGKYSKTANVAKPALSTPPMCKTLLTPVDNGMLKRRPCPLPQGSKGPADLLKKNYVLILK